jgi:ureidoglycolate hydrolase
MMVAETISSPARVVVRAQRLTEEAFRPYGRIVGPEREALTATDTPFAANLVQLRRVEPTIDYINRHLDHSQMFVPLSPVPVVLVVAPPEQPMHGFDPASIVAFIADGTQAFVLGVGTWHIEPRSLASDSCPMVNVQTTGFLAHTEIINFANHDLDVVLEIDVART